MVVAVFAGAGGAAIYSLKTGLLAKEHGALVAIMIALIIASNVGALAPLMWAMDRPAKPRDIAAALSAATDQERPVLTARLRDRAKPRHWQKPITVIQLAIMFEAVRRMRSD